MKLTFLGTGGGRFITITQKLATGGTIIEMDGEMIHLDPGPGALVRAKQYGVNLRNLTGIVITHAHPDHYTDAEMVCIAMTRGVKQTRGFVIGNEHLFNGSSDGNFRPVLSGYILKSVKKHKIMTPGDVFDTGNLRIKAVEARHGDPKALGYMIEGSKKIALTGDGEYYEGQAENFKGCDYLMINCLRPHNLRWPEHMNSETALKLISEVKPKLAILKDFGMKMIDGVAEKEAQWIEKETEIKTIVAKDGMKINDEPKLKISL